MPETAPRFSFLTTAYRTEDRIGGTIASVRAQTDPDWELVVVDNGMSDEMARIVNGHGDPRIRLIRQPNRGAAGGINTATVAARGRYVALLNSDDHVEPEFCARLGGVLDARPDVAAATCDARFFSATTGERLPGTYLTNAGAPRPGDGHEITLAEMIDGPCPYYTCAMRREVWQEHATLADDTVRVADLLVFLRVRAAGHRIVAVPDVLGAYCQADDSMSRGGASVLALEQQREQVVTHFAHASGRPEDLAALEREVRRSRHRRGVVGARMALFDGDHARARREIAEAARLSPDARTLLIRAGIRVAPRLVRRTYERGVTVPAQRSAPTSVRGVPAP